MKRLELWAMAPAVATVPVDQLPLPVAGSRFCQAEQLTAFVCVRAAPLLPKDRAAPAGLSRQISGTATVTGTTLRLVTLTLQMPFSADLCAPACAAITLDSVSLL